MQFRCTRCNNLIATLSGSNVTICGNATITGNFPPSNPHSDWLKCSSCNAWARCGSVADVSRRLEEERRRRRAQQEAHDRAVAAERQRQEAERRRQEEQRRQQQIQSLRNQFYAYKNNESDLQGQMSSKQREKGNEERIRADLVRQRDVERNLVSKFAQERSDPNTARIVLVGETGVGKSTLANRLIGDDSPYCDSASAVFRVNNGIHSQTAVIQKETRNVRLLNGTYKMIAVIDTPGLSDSAGRDRDHANMLCDYLRGVERVHAFVVVLSIANPRLDDRSVQGLRAMMSMFGRHFWRFVTVIYTNVDDDRLKQRLPKSAAELQTKIRTDFGLREGEAPLPVVGLGFKNWQEPMMGFIGNISVGDFYTCDRLHSPLDELEASIARQTRTIQGIDSQIGNLKSRMSQVKSSLNSTSASLRSMGISA